MNNLARLTILCICAWGLIFATWHGSLMDAAQWLALLAVTLAFGTEEARP